MSSSSSEITRLVSELDQCRQDLSAANERVQVSRREADRIRSSISDIRNETSRMMSDETSRRVAAEAKVNQLKSEVDREKRLRKEAEAAAESAANEQRRHTEFVSDARKQFESRLTQLVNQLRQREEQVHTLEYQVRDRDRERQRADALEKIVATREASLTTLSAELIQIRKDYMELNAHQTAQHHALQLAQKQIEEYQEQIQNMKQEMLQLNNNNNNSPSHNMNNQNNNSPSSSPPPPPEEDPHVQETARLVQFAREWVKDTMKDFVSVHSETDHLVQLIEDTFVILDKGSASAGLDLANTDRKRLSKMRELEASHLADQMTKLEGILPSSTVIRNGMSDVKFQISRIGTTVQGAVDAVRSIRALADKFCSQQGLPQINSKLDRLVAAQQQAGPAPLPTPQYQQFVDRQQQSQQNQQQQLSQHQNNSSSSQNNLVSFASKSSNNNSQQDTPREESTRAPPSPSSPKSPNNNNAPNNNKNNNNFPETSSSAMIMHPNMNNNSGPVVSLEEYIQLQQKLSQSEVSYNTEKVKLDGEIMKLKMQIQIEQDRVTSEKTKAEFEVERKFGEERRALQRKIDETEMKMTNLRREHENELRKLEHEKTKALEELRNELLEETRQVRDENKSLKRSNDEADVMIREFQEAVSEMKLQRKELMQDRKKFKDLLDDEKQLTSRMTEKINAADEAIEELANELEAAKKQIHDLVHENRNMMMTGNNNNNEDDTSGLLGFTKSNNNNQRQHQQQQQFAAANNNNNFSTEPNEGKNLWSEWQKNLAGGGVSGNSNSNSNQQITPNVLGRITSQAAAASSSKSLLPPQHPHPSSNNNNMKNTTTARSNSKPRFERVPRL